MAKILNNHVLKNVINKSFILPTRYFSVSTQSNDDKSNYDIIIAGGGLVGLSLAASLGKH